MRWRKVVAWAFVMRLRRSAISKALATSNGQMEGVSISVPVSSTSSRRSGRAALSSSKHQARGTEASKTRLLVTSAFIYQFSNGNLPEGDALAGRANVTNHLFEVDSILLIGRDKFRDGDAAQGDADGLSFGDFLQQRIEMSFCVE